MLGCSKDEIGTDSPEPPDQENNPCENITATYADDIRPIIDASCAISGCHVPGGEGSGDFEDYNGIKEKADSGNLMTRVVVLGDMPPANSTGPVPTAMQRNLIRCWIEDGAQMN